MTVLIRRHPEKTFAPDTVQPEKWQQQASCNGTSSNVFFPDQKNVTAITFAKRICLRCPVVQTCLDDALAQSTNPEGIWGGTTHVERAAIRRRQLAS